MWEMKEDGRFKKIDQKKKKTRNEQGKDQARIRHSIPVWTRLIPVDMLDILIPVCLFADTKHRSLEKRVGEQAVGGRWAVAGVFSFLSNLVLYTPYILRIYVVDEHVVHTSTFILHLNWYICQIGLESHLLRLDPWVFARDLMPTLGLQSEYELTQDAYFPITKEKNMFGLGFGADEIFWDLPNEDMYMKLVYSSIPRYRSALRLTFERTKRIYPKTYQYKHAGQDM